MSIQGGPFTIHDSSLVFHLDAGNLKSYLSGSTTWRDLSPNGNNGTLTNGPTYSSADGGSIVFDGTNDYVNIGVGKGINQFSGDFAINVWVMRTAGGPTWGNVIGDYYTGSTQNAGEWQIMMNASAAFIFYRAGTGYIINTASSGYSTNQWIHLVLTRIGSTVSMYSNGNNIANATNSETLGTATGNLNLGIDGDNAAEPLAGKIANVIIYKNKGLTSAEVLQNYNAAKSRFGL